MFSGCTVSPDSKKNKLGSSDQEASLSASKITEVVLVPCTLWKGTPKAISGGMDISEVPGCHLLRQMSSQSGSQKLLQGLMSHELTAYLSFFTYFITQWINPLSVNPTKWSNTLKQFVGKLPTNCLGVFDHFVGLALKGLSKDVKQKILNHKSLKLSFTNTRGLQSNFVEYELFLESNSPDILALSQMTLLRWLTFLLGSLTALLNLFLPSDPNICFTVVFSLMENSDQVFVSASIDFPSNSKCLVSSYNLWLI